MDAAQAQQLVAENEALAEENEGLVEEILRHRASAADALERERQLQALIQDTRTAQPQQPSDTTAAPELQRAHANVAEMRSSIGKLERENSEIRRMVEACQDIAGDAEAARASLEVRVAELQAQLHAKTLVADGMADLRAQLQASQATIEVAAEAAARTTEAESAARAQVERLEADMQSLTSQLRERDVEVQVLLASGEQAQHALAAHREQIENLDRERRALVQEKAEFLEARQRQLVQTTLRIFMNRTLSYSFRGWQDQVARFQTLRRVFTRCGAFFRMNMAARAFATWAGGWYAQRLLVRAIRKLNRRGIAKAFGKWVQNLAVQTITQLRQELDAAEQHNAKTQRTASLQSHKDGLAAEQIGLRAAALEKQVQAAQGTAAELALKHEQSLLDMQQMRTRMDSEHELRIEQLTKKFLASVAQDGTSLQFNRVRALQGCVHAWASAAKHAQMENQVQKQGRLLIEARQKHTLRMDLVIARSSRQMLQMLGFMAWKRGLADAQIATMEEQVKAEIETRRAVETVESHAMQQELEQLRHELWEQKAVISAEREARAAIEATARTLQLKQERFLQYQSTAHPYSLMQQAVWAWHTHTCKRAFANNSETWAIEKLQRREAEIQRIVRIAMRRACTESVRNAYDGWATHVAWTQKQRATMNSTWTAQTQSELLAAVESSSRAALAELKRSGGSEQQSMQSETLLARLDKQHRDTLSRLKSEHEEVKLRVKKEAADQLAAAKLGLQKATTVADSARKELEQVSHKSTAKTTRILECMRSRNLRVLLHNAFGAWTAWDVAARTTQLRIVRLLDGRKGRVSVDVLHNWQLTAHHKAANQRKVGKLYARKQTDLKAKVWDTWLQRHARSVRAPSMMVAALRLRKFLLKSMSFGAWLERSSRTLAKRETRRTRLAKALRVLNYSHVRRMFLGWRLHFYGTINDRREAFLRKEYGERHELVVAQETVRTRLIDDLLEKCITQTLRTQLRRTFRMWVGSTRRLRWLRSMGRAAILRLQRITLGETFRQWLVYQGMACTKGFREHSEHTDNLEAENEALLLERDELVERIEDLESMLNKTGVALSTVTEQHSRVLEEEWGTAYSPAPRMIPEGLPPNSHYHHSDATSFQEEVPADLMSYRYSMKRDLSKTAESHVERLLQERSERVDESHQYQGSRAATDMALGDEGTPDTGDSGDEIRSLLSGIQDSSKILRQQVGKRREISLPQHSGVIGSGVSVGFRADGRIASVVSGRSFSDIEAAVASS